VNDSRPVVAREALFLRVNVLKSSRPAHRERAGRHPVAPARSKIFEKSEKKPCHPLAGSLFLTAKPNPINGETNDKKRAL
jgi:hypothetical protein